MRLPPLPAQEYGARPLKRAVMHLVDDALSDAILGKVLQAGDTARMDIDAAGHVSVVATRPDEQPPPPALRSEIVRLPGLKKKVDVIVGA